MSDINRFGAAQTAVATRLDIMDTFMNNTKSQYESDLENVNEQLQRLEVEKRGAGLTETELAQMNQLQVQAAELALTAQTAKKANNATQKALSRIKSLEKKVDAFSPSWAATNCWNAISKWQGFKKSSSAKRLKGIFLPPQKFNNSSGTAIPDISLYGDGQSIFTMLSDAGIVPVLTDSGVTDWEKRAGEKPKTYLEKGDKAKDGMTVEGEKKNDFRPIKDWIDNDTITISDAGKYQVGKADKNVAATIQAFWNQHKSSAIKQVLEGATEDMDSENLWSTNNVLNPANPAFDKSNRNNIWNLLAYCGDSDVSPQDAAEEGGSIKRLCSISFLGNYSEVFGNAFSLYGFYKAKNGMFPYVEGMDTENTLSWKMELEGGSERDAYSSGDLPDTIEVVKVSDDDSEVVEAEKRRILSLKGFDSAEVGQVAYKKSETELGWTGTDCFKFVGTDGDGVVVGGGATTNVVTFASATNSNVKVTVSGSKDNTTITFGVYYR